ncbi:hypothetical protein Tco_0605921 [Tanacetum coccineum]
MFDLTALEQFSLSPDPQSQENVPQAAETVTTSNELDLLFSLMFAELLNGTTQVVSKSSAVTTADAPNQHQQQHTTPFTLITVAADTHPLNIQTTPETTSQAPTVTDNENIIQAKTNKEYAQVDEDEFINIFKHRWTKDHPLEQVIGNPSQSIRTRRQLEKLDMRDCMFALLPPGLKNKRDDENIVIRKKTSLVAKRITTNQERNPHEESFAPVARLEAVRLFVAYSSYPCWLKVTTVLEDRYTANAVPAPRENLILNSVEEENKLEMADLSREADTFKSRSQSSHYLQNNTPLKTSTAKEI